MIMKKAISVLIVLVMIFSFTACGQSTANENSKAAATADETKAASDTETSKAISEGGKTLIVYFSWSTSGNTEKMANTIKERTGGDILKIKPTTAYPTDYSECGDVAKAERDENARPKIANLPNSIDEYDTIFVGYPIWLAYHKLIQCTQIA